MGRPRGAGRCRCCTCTASSHPARSAALALDPAYVSQTVPAPPEPTR